MKTKQKLPLGRAKGVGEGKIVVLAVSVRIAENKVSVAGAPVGLHPLQHAPPAVVASAAVVYAHDLAEVNSLAASIELQAGKAVKPALRFGLLMSGMLGAWPGGRLSQ